MNWILKLKTKLLRMIGFQILIYMQLIHLLFVFQEYHLPQVYNQFKQIDLKKWTAGHLKEFFIKIREVS